MSANDVDGDKRLSFEEFKFSIAGNSMVDI